jgi:hypothetical protein
MIRGAIEVAQKSRVAGWIYSSADTVRDKLILAFVGARCVGSGKVDRFRKDLLEAKLGDGYCGFDFPIKLNDGEKLGAVVVKLQSSDAALIQRDVVLTGPNDVEEVAEGPDLGAISPASVAWMQDRGWLEQQEYDFLKAVHNLGGYERGLRPARRAGGDAQAPAKPETVVQDLLGVFCLGEVDIVQTRVASISDLAGEKSPLKIGGASVVALWSPDRARISLEERSHHSPAAERGRILPEPPQAGIDYSFGPDRLLFLHRDCSFAPLGPAPAGGITVFTATPRAAAKNTDRSQSRAA